MLTLHPEKFIFVSLLSITTLLAGAALSSEGCGNQASIWNQQIQSSANFNSIATNQCK